MNQDNQFPPRFGQQNPQQYGFSSYDMPPAGKKGFVAKVFGDDIADKVSSPLFATGALLVAGVAFAAVIMAAYPDSPEDQDIPVVTADAMQYKEIPTEPGGMVIPNRDSTIFSAMNEEGTAPEPLENLLAEPTAEEEPVDKLAAFARQVEESVESEAATAGEAAEETAPDDSVTTAAAETEETEPVTLSKVVPKETITEQKIRVIEAKPPAAGTTTTAAAESETRPKIVHKPGENPETLAFVRDVLDKKDTGGTTTTTANASDVATGSAAIEPASGTPATQDFTITPGSHYVQLASVKSLDGAEGEWGKLQKEYTAELGSVPHRVQAADLGEKGTFYRIQAGPMSKDSAVKICESIKSQKPGGCLVTQ